MKNEEKEKLLKFYYDNDSAELKSSINGVLFRLNYNQCNDLDEFYSMAGKESKDMNLIMNGELLLRLIYQES